MLYNYSIFGNTSSFSKKPAAPALKHCLIYCNFRNILPGAGQLI